MKNHLLFFGAVLLSIFSSVSLSATQSFWAFGNDNAHQPKYLSSIGKGTGAKNFSIAYVLGSNWTNISAKLWLKAVDDSFNSTHCTKASCVDGTGRGQDASEQAEISKIEGTSGLFSKTEIDAYGWYDLGLDVTSYLLKDIDGKFNASVRASSLGDFYYKNAKLVIDYSIATPIPATVWLFVPALLGMMGLKRKAKAA